MSAPTIVPASPAVQQNREANYAALPSRVARLEWPFDGSERPASASLSGRPVVLAFDGSAESDAAARVADAMATQLHASVSVVSIIDSSPVPIPYPLDLAIGIAGEGAGGAIHEGQAREVREQIATVVAHPVDWATTVALGLPADAISREASRAGAALVVMGLSVHGLVDRAVHQETALSVMRKADGPVLGVVADARGLPSRAVVAMDFSRASVRAAEAAAELMATGGVLTLAYVESIVEHPAGTGDGVIHALGIEAAFVALARRLASDVLLVDHVILHHTEPCSPSHILLEYADAMRADLLAAGSARHGRLDRILLGSVSAELARAGRCSVLVVPPVQDTSR